MAQQGFDVFGASLADVVLDETHEVGNTAPHERTDLSVPRDDLAELDVRTAALKLDTATPEGALRPSAAKSAQLDAPYGLCPTCGEPGVTRCRCPMGDTQCKNGHAWHFKGGELHLTNQRADGKHPVCDENCQVLEISLPGHVASKSSEITPSASEIETLGMIRSASDFGSVHTAAVANEVKLIRRAAQLNKVLDQEWHALGFSVTAAPSADKVFVESTTGWRGWVSKKTLQKKPGKYKTVDPNTHKPTKRPPKGTPLPGKTETTHPVDKLLQKEPPKPADVHADDLPDPMTAAPASVHMPDFEGLKQEGGLWKDSEGRKYYFSTTSSPGFKHKTYAAQAGSNLASMCLPPGLYIPYKAIQTPEGAVGLLYPQHNTNDLTSDSLVNLTHEQAGQMLAHAAVDWLLGKHNTSVDNMQVDEAGNIMPTGYASAFQGLLDDNKAAPKLDSLSPAFQQLLGNFMTGASSLDLQDLGPYIEHVEKIPDAKWAEQVKLAADAMPVSDQAKAQIVQKALERKQNLRKTFEKIFGGVLSGKTDGATYTFKFDTPTVEPIYPPATSDASLPGVLPPPDAKLPSKSLPGPAQLKGTGKSLGGGTKSNEVLVDDHGNKYLFKPHSKARISVQQAVGDLSGLIAPQGEYVPCAAIEFGGKPGSLQPILSGVVGDGKQVSFTPQALTPQQKKDVQREAVLDWVFSNHDGHRGNILLLDNGRMIGVDKEQAFRFMVQTPDKEKLSVDYHPNSLYGEQEPFKNTVYRAFAQGKIDLDLNETLPFIQQIENVSDAKWTEAVTPYVDALAEEKGWNPAQKKQLLDRILARKNGTREDFRKFFSGLLTQRTGKPTTFVFADESAPGVKKAPTPDAAPPEQAAVVPSEVAPGAMPPAAAPEPAAEKKTTGKCPKGHKTYKSPVPHNCPTCGRKMTPEAGQPQQTKEEAKEEFIGGSLEQASKKLSQSLAVNPGGDGKHMLKTLAVNFGSKNADTLAEALLTGMAMQGNHAPYEVLEKTVASFGKIPKAKLPQFMSYLFSTGLMEKDADGNVRFVTAENDDPDHKGPISEEQFRQRMLKAFNGVSKTVYPMGLGITQSPKKLREDIEAGLAQVSGSYPVMGGQFNYGFFENVLTPKMLVGVEQHAPDAGKRMQAFFDALVSAGAIKVVPPEKKHGYWQKATPDEQTYVLATDPLVAEIEGASAAEAAPTAAGNTTAGYEAAHVTFDKTPKEGVVVNGIPLASAKNKAGYWAQTPDAPLQEPPIKQVPGKKPASGVLVVEPDGRVWIVEPTNHYGGYNATFPKGKQEPELSPQQNALKELFEEAGLTAEITGFLGDAEGDTSITRYYVAKRTGGAPWDAHWESQSVRLASPEEAAKILNKPRDQATLQLLQQHTQAQPQGTPPGEGAAVPAAEPKKVNFDAVFKGTFLAGDSGPQKLFVERVNEHLADGKALNVNVALKELFSDTHSLAARQKALQAAINAGLLKAEGGLVSLAEGGKSLLVEPNTPINIEVGEIQEAKEPTAECPDGHKTYQTPPPDYCNQCGKPMANAGLAKSLGIDTKLQALSQAFGGLSVDVIAKALQQMQSKGISVVPQTLGMLLGYSSSEASHQEFKSFADKAVELGLLVPKGDGKQYVLSQSALLPDKPEAAPAPAPEVPKPPVAVPPDKPEVKAPTETQDLAQPEPTPVAPPAPVAPTEKGEPTFVHKPLGASELAALAKDAKIKPGSPVFNGLSILNGSAHPLTAKDIVASLTEKHEHTKNMLTTALEKLAAQGKVKKITAPDGQTHYFMGDVEGVEGAATQGPKQPDEAARPLHDHLQNLGVKPAVVADIANALTVLGAGGKEFTAKEFVQHVVQNGDPAVGWYATYANNWIKGALAKKGIVSVTPDGKYKVNDFPTTPTGQCPKGHNTYLKPAPDHCPTCGTPMAPGSEQEVSAPEPAVKAEPLAEKTPEQVQQEQVEEISDLLGLPTAPAEAPVPSPEAMAIVDSITEPTFFGKLTNQLADAGVDDPKAFLDALVDAGKLKRIEVAPELFAYGPVAPQPVPETPELTPVDVGPTVPTGEVQEPATGDEAPPAIGEPQPAHDPETVAKVQQVLESFGFPKEVSEEKVEAVLQALEAVAGQTLSFKQVVDLVTDMQVTPIPAVLLDKLLANGLISKWKPSLGDKPQFDINVPQTDVPQTPPVEDTTPQPTFDDETLSKITTALGSVDLGILAPKPQDMPKVVQALAAELSKLTGEHTAKELRDALKAALTSTTGVLNPSLLAKLSLALSDAGVVIKAGEKEGLSTWYVNVKPVPAVQTPTGEPQEDAVAAGPPHPTITQAEQAAILDTVAARLHLNEDEKGQLLDGLAALYGHASDNKALLVSHFQKVMGLEDVPLGYVSAKKTVDYLVQEGLLVPTEDGELAPKLATPSGKCKNGHNTYKEPVPPHCPTCGAAMNPIEVMKPEGGEIGNEEADSEMFAGTPISQKVLITEVAKSTGITKGLSALKDAISDALFDVPSHGPVMIPDLIDALKEHAPYLTPDQAVKIIDGLVDRGVFAYSSEDDMLDYKGANAPLAQLESPELTPEKMTAAGVPKGVQSKVISTLQLLKHYHGSTPVKANVVEDELSLATGLSEEEVEDVCLQLEDVGILKLTKAENGSTSYWLFNFDVHEPTENKPVQELAAGVDLDAILSSWTDVDETTKSIIKSTLAQKVQLAGSNKINPDDLQVSLIDAGVDSLDVQALFESGVVSDDGTVNVKFESNGPPKTYGPEVAQVASILSGIGYTDPADHAVVHEVLTELKKLGTNAIPAHKLWAAFEQADTNMSTSLLIEQLQKAGLMQKTVLANGTKVWALNYGGDIKNKPTDGSLESEFHVMLTPFTEAHGEGVNASVQNALKMLAKSKAKGYTITSGVLLEQLVESIQDNDQVTGLEGDKAYGAAELIRSLLFEYGIVTVDDQKMGSLAFSEVASTPTAKCKNGHNTYLMPVPKQCTTCGCSMQSSTSLTEEEAPTPPATLTEKKVDTDKVKAALAGDLGSDIADSVAEVFEKEVALWSGTIDVLGFATALDADVPFAQSICDMLVKAGIVQKLGNLSYKLVAPAAAPAEPEGVDKDAVKAALSYLPAATQEDAASFLQEMFEGNNKTMKAEDALAVEGIYTWGEAKSLCDKLEGHGILKPLEGVPNMYVIVGGSGEAPKEAPAEPVDETEKDVTEAITEIHEDADPAVLKGIADMLKKGEQFSTYEAAKDLSIPHMLLLEYVKALVAKKLITPTPIPNQYKPKAVAAPAAEKSMKDKVDEVIAGIPEAAGQAGEVLSIIELNGGGPFGFDNFADSLSLPTSVCNKILDGLVEAGVLVKDGAYTWKAAPKTFGTPAAIPTMLPVITPSATTPKPVTATAADYVVSSFSKQYGDRVRDLLNSYPQMAQWESMYPGLGEELGKLFAKKRDDYGGGKSTEASALQELHELGLSGDDAGKFFEVMKNIGAWEKSKYGYGGLDWQIGNLADTPTGTCPNGHKTYKDPKPKYCPTCGKPLVAGEAVPSVVHMPNELMSKVDGIDLLDDQAKQVAKKVIEAVDVNDAFSTGYLKKAMQELGMETYGGYGTGNPVSDMLNKLVHAGLFMKVPGGLLGFAPIEMQPKEGVPFTQKAYNNGLISPNVTPAKASAVVKAQADLETGGPKTAPSKTLAFIMGSSKPVTLQEIMLFAGGGSAPSTVTKNKITKMLQAAKAQGILEGADNLYFVGNWKAEAGLEGVPVAADTTAPLDAVLQTVDADLTTKYPKLGLGLENIINTMAEKGIAHDQSDWYDLLKDLGVVSTPVRVQITKALVAAGKLQFSKGQLSAKEPAAVYKVEDTAPAVDAAVMKGHSETYNAPAMKNPKNVAVAVAKTLLQAKKHAMTKQQFVASVQKAIEAEGLPSYKAGDVAVDILDALETAKFITTKYVSALNGHQIDVRGDPALAVPATPGVLSAPKPTGWDALKSKLAANPSLAPYVNTIIDHLSVKTDGPVDPAAVDAEFSSLGVPLAALVNNLIEAGVIVPDGSNWSLKLPKATEPVGGADAMATLSQPTGTCPAGHKTYKTPPPFYCPTCGKKMQAAAGLPAGASHYNSLLGALGFMTYDAQPFPPKEALVAALEHYVDDGSLSPQELLAGIKELISAFQTSEPVSAESLSENATMVANGMVDDDLLIRNELGQYIFATPKMHDGVTVVSFEEAAQKAGEIEPYAVPADSDLDEHTCMQLIKATHASALIAQTGKATQVMQAVLALNSNAGVSWATLFDSGKMPVGSSWILQSLRDNGLIQKFTGSDGEDRYFIGGWKKKTTSTAPGAVAPKPTPSSSVISVGHVLAAAGIGAQAAEVYSKAIEYFGYNTPINTQTFVDKLSEELVSAGLPLSSVAQGTSALKTSGMLKSHASDFTITFSMPDVPPCSAPKGAQVPFNLDDYNAGKIIAVPGKVDAAKANEALGDWPTPKREACISTLAMMGATTFTVEDLVAAHGGTLFKKPTGATMLEDLVEADLLQKFSYTDETGTVQTKYFVGHWEKATDAPLAGPPQSKIPTGLCKNGHKTYVTPKPHNCPTCGVVLDSLESGMAQALVSKLAVSEGTAQQVVAYVLKIAPTGDLNFMTMSEDLGIGADIANGMLQWLAKPAAGAVLKKVTSGGAFSWAIDEAPDLVLMPAPSGVTVASTYSTPMGDAAKPPKVMYDAALAASGVIKPVVTEFDLDQMPDLAAIAGPNDGHVVATMSFLSSHQKKTGKPITAVELSAHMMADGHTWATAQQVTTCLALAAIAGPNALSQQGTNINTATFLHGYWTASHAAASAKVPETVVSSVELPTSKSFEKLIGPHFTPQTAKFLSAFLLENNGKTMTTLDVAQAMIDAGMSGGQAGSALKKLTQMGFVSGSDGAHTTFHYPDPAHDADIAGLSDIVKGVQNDWNEPDPDVQTAYDYKVWLALRELQDSDSLPTQTDVEAKLQAKIGIGAQHAHELVIALVQSGVLQAPGTADGHMTIVMPSTLPALKYVSEKGDQVLPVLQSEFNGESWEHYPTGLAEKVMSALTSIGPAFTATQFGEALGTSTAEAKEILAKLGEMGLSEVALDPIGNAYSKLPKMAPMPTGKCPDGHNTYLVPLPAHCTTCGKPMSHAAPSTKINLEPETAPEPASPELFTKTLKEKFSVPDALGAALGQGLFSLVQSTGSEGFTQEELLQVFSAASQSTGGAPMNQVQIEAIIKGMASKGALHEFLPGKYELLFGTTPKEPDKPLTAADAKVTRNDVAGEVEKLMHGLGYLATIWDSSASKGKKKYKFQNTGTKVRVYFGPTGTKGILPHFIEINPDGSLDYLKGCPLADQGKVQGHVDKGLQAFFKSKIVQTVKPKLPAVPAVAPVVPAVPAAAPAVAPMPPPAPAFTPVTTTLPAGQSAVPAEFLEAPTFDTSDLDLVAPLVPGVGAMVSTPKEAPKGPTIVPYTEDIAMAKHGGGWSPNGKGHGVVKALAAAGEGGLTYAELLENTKAHLQGEKLTTWKESSLNTILESGKTSKCIYEIPGSSPAKYALGYIEEPDPPPAAPLAPPDSFIPHSAPPGSDHRAYYVASRLGFNLHDDAQRAAWEASPYYELVQGLAVNPRTGESLAALGVSKQTMKALVDRGLVTMNEIPAWNDAKFASATFKLSMDPVALDRPKLLPPPGIVEFGPTGKVKGVVVSAAMQDAVSAVLPLLDTKSGPAAELALKFMTSDPGRLWAILDLQNMIDTTHITSMASAGILQADGDSYRVNWPLVLSATTDTNKPVCPKCKVRHRDAHMCPHATPKPKAGVPASVPKPGTYSIPVSDVSVTPLAAVVTVADNESEPPLTQEQAKELLKQQGVAVKKGSKMAHLIEICQNPLTPADISVAMTNLGFKGNANAAVKEAVDAGVIVKLPNGKFVLKGHGNKQKLPLPGEAGPLMSEAAPQPNVGASEIRRQFSPDHPIQRMAPHHAQRFAEILSYMRDAADTDTRPIADLTPGKTLSFLSSRMNRAIREIVLKGTNSWGGTAHGSQYCAMLCDTFEQIGMSTNDVYPGAPTMKNKPIGGKDGGGHWSQLSSSEKSALWDSFGVDGSKYMSNDWAGKTFFSDPDDPDAPMFVELSSNEAASYDSTEAKKVGSKWYVKLPSRADLVLQQYAVTQAAYAKHNTTGFGIYRGVKGHVVGYMQKSEAAQKGHGAHLGVRGATGWTTEKGVASGFGTGVVMHRESMPVHQVFLHYAQQIDGHNVFGTFSHETGGGGEREIIVIGHAAVAQGSVHKGGVVKFASKRRAQVVQPRSFPPPLPDPSIPKGFARYVMNPDGIYYWVTSNDATVVLPLEAEGPAFGSLPAPSENAATAKQARFDFSVADAVEGTVQS